MKLIILIFSNILTILTSCNGQNTSKSSKGNSKTHLLIIAIGDTVSELDKAIFIIFQDKNNNYWFGSDGQGVYHYDGKPLFISQPKTVCATIVSGKFSKTNQETFYLIHLAVSANLTE
ncbi:MAG: hypothetical protein WKF35_03400 [Ferruginibacter sp.]